ncbi:hypothetical protein BTVI_59678 [Pitangus sulphuratus]|nr:hypothetical protein BTVI_59678 [Pitangus sulphuratus]
MEEDETLQGERERAEVETGAAAAVGRQISVSEFLCHCCYDILVNPTTLNCGHSFCRHCLALWWVSSKKNECPECREKWEGFPKVNILLRDVIEKLFSDAIEQRKEDIQQNSDVARSLATFQKYGNDQTPTVPNTARFNPRGGGFFSGVLTALTCVAVVLLGYHWSSREFEEDHLVHKPVAKWSAEEVILWLEQLGPWASHYRERFLLEKVNGRLLLTLTEEDFTKEPYSIENSNHRKAIMAELEYVKALGVKPPQNLWEYKAVNPGKSLFLLYALKSSPRLSMLYLYLFDYAEAFLPFIHTICPMQEDKHEDVFTKLLDLKDPSWKQWREFIVKYLFLPYQLIAEFAWDWLDVHYWTSRFIIVNAMLLSVLELFSFWRLWSRRELKEFLSPVHPVLGPSSAAQPAVAAVAQEWHIRKVDVQDNMSNVSEERSTRQQDIKKGLQFIESTLPYPGTQEQYELFIRDLVRNLFNEGNDVYREGDWRGSLSHYTEAINIADYANSEEIHVSDDVLEKLHVNRIACFSNMGLHEKVLEDCEIALRLNENNFRALYRKAKALNELGRYKKAYDAVAKCSLAVPQDESVIKLTQELAQKLGLKIRKAYVRAKPPSSNSVPSDLSTQNSSVEDIELDLSDQKQETVSAASSSDFVSEVSKVSPVPVPSLSAVMPLQMEKVPLPSAVLANGGNVSFPMPEACLDCGDGDIIIGEELDELLDSVPDPDEGVMPLASSLENFCSPLSTFSISDPKRDVAAEEECRYPGHCTFAYCQEEIDVWTLERKGAFSREALFGGSAKINLTVSRLLQEHHGLFMFLYISHDTIVQESKKYWQNMEASAHGSQILGNQMKYGSLNLKMKFVCGQCWRNGQVNEPDRNKKYCSAKARHPWTKDRRVVLVMSNERKKWMTIRPLPAKKQVPLQFDLCNHIASGKKCQYDGNCSFAHSPEEREMWTYMKENSIQDLEQLYDIWLKSQKPEKGDDAAAQANKENGKQIHMPTDYAEVTQTLNMQHKVNANWHAKLY